MPTTRRMRRRLAGAAMAVLAVAATTIVASPAQAASATYIHPEWVDGCPGCPGPVDFGFAVRTELDDRVAIRVGGLVARGTGLLIEAVRAGEGRDAGQLADAGMAALAKASAATGHSGFVRAADWDGGWCGNEPKPWPHPNRDFSLIFEEAETSLAAGLTTLGEAAGQLDGDVREAMQERAADVLLDAAAQLAMAG